MNTNTKSIPIKLTQYSHGAGCGCKISPALLDTILKDIDSNDSFPKLLIGNKQRDDAAVYDMGNGDGLISTVDFFMSVVDDPFQFGQIAAANAISDVYAMGGTPLMAISILGWPVKTIQPEIARRVLEGAISICKKANIPLAGGHSIDCPEPVFGLSVNGRVKIKNIKANNTAKIDDYIVLTKPLGAGIYTTAAKKEIIDEIDLQEVCSVMTFLNSSGEEFGKMKNVNAMTDVTGFGLAGHLIEMAESSELSAEVDFKELPLLKNLFYYIEKDCIPGGTNRNYESYGQKISGITEEIKSIICDPQTSGGLLLSIPKKYFSTIQKIISKSPTPPLLFKRIGKFIKKKKEIIYVV